MPFDSREGSRPLKQVLPVVEIKNRIVLSRIFRQVVAGRQPHPQKSFVVKYAAGKFMQTQIAYYGSGVNSRIRQIQLGRFFHRQVDALRSAGAGPHGVDEQEHGQNRDREDNYQRTQAEYAPNRQNEFLHVRQVKCKSQTTDGAQYQDCRRLRLRTIKRGERQQPGVSHNSNQRHRHTGNRRVFAAVHEVTIERLTKVAIGGFRFPEMVVERHRGHPNTEDRKQRNGQR